MGKRTFHYTCSLRDGEHSDGTWNGTVKADSEQEARAKIADDLHEEGKSRRPKNEWRAYDIHLT
jgi:hypothetical protein